jgi:SPOR domain
MPDACLKTPKKNCAAILVLIQLIGVCFLLPELTRGAALPQDQQKEPIGVLTTTGDVYVNQAAAPLGSAIFAGDVLLTGRAGNATVTSDGKGTFKISPNTQVVFAADPQYIAELNSGSVVISSANGFTGITLRVGSSVVLAETEGERSTATVEAPSNGSFAITCLEGSVGVVSLEGPQGLFIRAGQSVDISPQGELSASNSRYTSSVPRTRVQPELAKPIASDTRNLIPPYTNSSAGKYFDVGKFRDGLRANQMADELGQLGFRAIIVHSRFFLIDSYHILVGPYEHGEEADAARQGLDSRGFSPRILPSKSKRFTLPPMTLYGTDLTIRDCIISWELNSPEATVEFMQGRNVVATAKGTWQKRDFAFKTNALVSQKSERGPETLLEIQRAGTDQGLVLEGSALRFYVARPSVDISPQGELSASNSRSTSSVPRTRDTPEPDVGPKTTVHGYDSDLSRATLKGITSVFVVVENLDDDAKKIGLTEESIKTDVELKLLMAGMNFATNGFTVPGNTHLHVNVGVLPPQAASIQVELLLRRNSEPVFGATNWSLHGEITNPTLQGIRDFIKQLVDQFLNAWLSVNPK